MVRESDQVRSNRFCINSINDLDLGFRHLCQYTRCHRLFTRYCLSLCSSK